MAVQETRPHDTQPITMLHYILGGRAEKVESRLFMLRKLWNSLLSVERNENVVAGPRNYVPTSYGSSQCCIPAGCTAYPSNHLSRLKKQEKITSFP